MALRGVIVIGAICLLYLLPTIRIIRVYLRNSDSKRTSISSRLFRSNTLRRTLKIHLPLPILRAPEVGVVLTILIKVRVTYY